eukprot:snap_masked-scaffold_27-processed-gene-4.44-mRNA-1 protein AED:1.00 eAED:1.00 QI:0/-1/0/0/-1/1/1/0/110
MSSLNDLRLTMKSGVSSIRAASRLISAKKAALKENLHLLERNGIIERDPCSIWSSADSMVPTAFGGFRMAFDLNRLNECVVMKVVILPAVKEWINWLPSELDIFLLFLTA